ncbi:MAG: transposase [Chitinophagaceae bacterium]
MTTIKRYYTTEFKIKAVELSNLKGSVNQVAKELDVPEKNIRQWKQEFSLGKLGIDYKPDKTKSAIELENIALKKSIYDTKLENDILKKALAIFTKKDR